MYDEEEKGDDEDELEDIIEEAHEDESEDSDGAGINRVGGKKKKNKQDLQRQNQKEELKSLKTQMLTMQDQLNRKANKIDEIKSTLKQSSAIMMKQGGGSADEQDISALNVAQQKSFIGGVPTDNILDVLDEDEEVLENKLKDINEAEEPDKDILNLNSDESDGGNGLDFGTDEEEDEDDGMDNGIKDQTDPQILKLQDRIKFFRHRCVASLGNNLYEKAYNFLKESNADGATAEENRQGLIQILGEDWIGFWAILDQIMFYEGMVDELSTIGGTEADSNNSRSQDDVSFSDEDQHIAKRKNLDPNKGHFGNNLNDDSDDEEDKRIFELDNDGEQVGGSGSEKGEAM